MTKFMQLGRDESGATAIEYALIASLIAVVIIGAVTTVGMEVKRLHQRRHRALGQRSTGGGSALTGRAFRPR